MSTLASCAITWPRLPGKRTLYRTILADWVVEQFKETHQLTLQVDRAVLFVVEPAPVPRCYLKLVGEHHIELHLPTQSPIVTLSYRDKRIDLPVLTSQRFRELLSKNS